MLKDENNQWYCFVVLIIFSLFLVRIINLECDLPGYGMTFYQPIDEGLYSRAAINYCHYGNFFSTGKYELSLSSTFKSNAFNIMLQILSFKVFGNTYYGLRMPSVIIAGIIFVLIYITIRKIFAQSLKPLQNRMLTILFMVYVLFDFSFLILSRVVENSNMRALSGILAVFIYSKTQEKEKLRYFLLGMLSVISIFLIYFSNVFILLALGMLVLTYVFRKQWDMLKAVIHYGGVGVLTGLILSEIYYRIIWNTGALQSFFDGVFSFSERTSTSLGQTVFLIRWIKNCLIFWDSNMFFYGILLLFITLLALIVNLYTAIKKRKDFDLFVCFLIIAMVVQAVFFHDWMERKSITIYPVLIGNAALFFTNLEQFQEILKRKYAKHVSILFVVFYIFLLYTMIRFRINYSYFPDFDSKALYVVVCGAVVQIIIIFILLFVYLLNKTTLKIVRILSCLCFLIGIAVNGYFDFEYAFSYDLFTEKQAMVEIGKTIGNNYVLGPYAYGFTLYNEIQPVSQDLDVCGEYIKSSDMKYVIDYTHGAFYADQILSNGGKTGVLIDSYERSISIYGRQDYEIGVFRKDSEE